MPSWSPCPQLTCLQAGLQLVEVFRSNELQQALEQVHVGKAGHEHQGLGKAHLGSGPPDPITPSTARFCTAQRGANSKNPTQNPRSSSQQDLGGIPAAHLLVSQDLGDQRDVSMACQESSWRGNKNQLLVGSKLPKTFPGGEAQRSNSGYGNWEDKQSQGILGKDKGTWNNESCPARPFLFSLGLPCEINPCFLQLPQPSPTGGFTVTLTPLMNALMRNARGLETPPVPPQTWSFEFKPHTRVTIPSLSNPTVPVENSLV